MPFVARELHCLVAFHLAKGGEKGFEFVRIVAIGDAKWCCWDGHVSFDLCGNRETQRSGDTANLSLYQAV